MRKFYDAQATSGGYSANDVVLTAEKLLTYLIPTANELLSPEQYNNAINSIKECIKEAIKADRLNLLDHVEVVEEWNTGFSGSASSIDKDSLLNAPMIELL